MPSHNKSILLIADPILPIPPPLYGGIERIVDFLAESLAARGWNVQLACHPESECEVNQLHHPALGIDRNSRIKNLRALLPPMFSGRFDIVHSFAQLDMTLPLWPFKKPVIQSFQAMPNWRSLKRRTALIPRKNLFITVCGQHMVNAFEAIAPTTGIHNGIILEQFDFRSHVESDAPLVFLGRIEPIKGTHSAIQIALQTKRKLIIAGNRSHEPELDRYFVEQIEPHLSEQIQYIGPVNNQQKNDLLGNAFALLMPIEWDEPFGIVMAEALACGTPVIGTGRGALPEIIINGKTGQACKDVGEMVDAVRKVDAFSREACRNRAELTFSSEVIVDQYVQLYEKVLAV